MGVGVRVPGPTLGRGQGWLPSAGHRMSVCETGPLFAQTPLRHCFQSQGLVPHSLALWMTSQQEK